MESSHWTTDSQFTTPEAFDYDLYVDRENSNQLLTPPVRSVGDFAVSAVYFLELSTLGIARQFS